jgi:hypothetical protein
MLSFIEYLQERKVDPVALAHRVARRYGSKKTNYGPWMNAKHGDVRKGGHIPLSSYSAPKVRSMENKYDRHIHSHPDSPEGARKERESKPKVKMSIKDLHATQPFNRTSDDEKLKSKIADTNPDHIHVVTHKGVHYVADGHHAVMAAHLRGETHVNVHHTNLDE